MSRWRSNCTEQRQKGVLSIRSGVTRSGMRRGNRSSVHRSWRRGSRMWYVLRDCINIGGMTRGLLAGLLRGGGCQAVE